MPNVIRVGIDGVEDLLNAGEYGAGALVRVQSSATETGAFASVGTSALVSGTRLYAIFDAAGASSTWYRWRVENAGGTTVGDWSTAFQVTLEEAGGVCSLYDVKQRLIIAPTDTTNDEELLEFIADVTADIIGYTGRRFVRLPLAGTASFLFDLDEDSTVLWIPQGVSAVTTLEVAAESQPDVGGAYAAVPAADWVLRPAAHLRDAGWPATRIELRDNGSTSWLPAGLNTIRLTGALGWDEVPPDVSRIGAMAVVRRFKNRAAATVNRGGDPQDVMARWAFSLEDQRKLDWYRVPHG